MESDKVTIKTSFLQSAVDFILLCETLPPGVKIKDVVNLLNGLSTAVPAAAPAQPEENSPE